MKQSALTILLGTCAWGVAACLASPAAAQCTTCPTPVVAYSPVAVQPTVTYTPYEGWYPGKLLDRWRMRRYGYSEPVAVTAAYTPYTAAYTPYTASYVPYTASYAPAATYTASYAPYTASYAPTSSSYVTAYAPLGQRQVLMRPVVVASPVVSSGCTACSYTDPCNSCSACSAAPSYSGVSAATYTEPACSSCAGGSSSSYAAPSYATPDYATSGGNGLSAPSLAPNEAVPSQSNYPENEPEKPVPGPATETNTYYDLEAPALFDPADRTAQRDLPRPIQRGASVDVWDAVYRKPAGVDNVSVEQPAATNDAADGWSSVPAAK